MSCHIGLKNWLIISSSYLYGIYLVELDGKVDIDLADASGALPVFWKKNLQLIMNFEDFDQAYEWFVPRHDPMSFSEMTKAQLRNAVKLFKEDQGPRIAYVAEYLSSTRWERFSCSWRFGTVVAIGQEVHG